MCSKTVAAFMNGLGVLRKHQLQQRKDVDQLNTTSPEENRDTRRVCNANRTKTGGNPDGKKGGNRRKNRPLPNLGTCQFPRLPPKKNEREREKRASEHVEPAVPREKKRSLYRMKTRAIARSRSLPEDLNKKKKADRKT